MCDSVRPHRRQPTRLLHPWDSPGKNTGVGCHFLLQCMKVKSESEVVQSCLTLSDPMDCRPPGSSICGIFQARVLEWGAIAFSTGDRDSSLIGGLGWSPGGWNDNPLQYSCWKIPWTEEHGGLNTVHGVTKSQTWLNVQERGAFRRENWVSLVTHTYGEKSDSYFYLKNYASKQ